MDTILIERERNLTKNEAVVIKSLLSGSAGSGEDRIRKSGLARSTYRDAKRRMYASGIVEDRYIPSGAAAGAFRVSFLIARPYTNKAMQASQVLSGVPGTVVCWASPQLLFGVAFSLNETIYQSLHRQIQQGAFGTVVLCMEVDPDPRRIPVYFDYEGAWGHFTGLSGSARYPRAIPHSSGSPIGPPLMRTRDATSFRQLLQRPLTGEGRRHEPHLFGPAALPRLQQRWLGQGLVDWRVLLSPQNPPSYRGVSVSELLFVLGVLRNRKGLAALLSDLTETCGAYPFLLASDGNQVLLSSLATGRTNATDGPLMAPPRAPVTPVLSSHLDNIDCIRQPLSLLQIVVNHRYDRLVDPQDDG
jgi:hypothetical protein